MRRPYCLFSRCGRAVVSIARWSVVCRGASFSLVAASKAANRSQVAA